jgi:hypothetical protein
MTSSGFAGGPTPGDPLGDDAESPGVKEQAQQAASTAAGEGKHVAGVAAEQASNVAGEARSQAQGLMRQAGQEVETQSRQQKDRLAGGMRTFSDDLEQMASQGSGMAGQLAHEVAQRARAFSTHLEQREPRDLLEDVRDFARRKPGTFLLGALAAGVVAGRLARGAKDAQSSQAPSTLPSTTTATFEDPIGAPPLATSDPILEDARLNPAEPGGRL